MTQQPGVVAIAVAVGAVLDFYSLLLIPFRLGGHLVPLGPVLVLVVNLVLGLVVGRLAARLMIGVAVVLSIFAAGRGPGGDLLVTRDLQGVYLLWVAAAVLGAGLPLMRRPRRKPTVGEPRRDFTRT